MSLTLTLRKQTSIKQSNTKSTSYLPGLNGIRAIAILIVIAAHTDEFAYLFHRHSVGLIGNGVAVHAVTLFFVLSGYLITYLLMLEKERFQKIHFKKFYMRRALRIWPIYFLMVAIAYVIHIHGDITPEYKVVTICFLYYLLFIPNIFFAMGGILHPITPLWSIGVEEQFYAFWPFVIDKSRNILKMMLLIIVVYLGLKFTLQFMHQAKAFRIVSVTRIDSMAIGGVAAYLLLKNNKLLKIAYHPLVQIACWATMIYSLIFGAIHVFSILDSELYSILFAIFILNVSSNPKTIISTENKTLNFLGKISYGLFAYHMSVIFLLSYLFKHHNLYIPDRLFIISIYIITLAITIVIAYCSYEFFEKRFLKLKQRYVNTSAPPVTTETGLATA
ncbi:MAG: acyltransferase family protein [Flavipsychrobacter sp.]